LLAGGNLALLAVSAVWSVGQDMISTGARVRLGLTMI
jgi:hypothetical protein